MTKTEESIELIEKANKDFEKKEELRYGIEDIKTNKLVGCCSLFGFDAFARLGAYG